MKAQLSALNEADWQSLLNKRGAAIAGQDTYRMAHWISGYEKPFTLVIQRKQIKGQAALDLESEESSEEILPGGYVYRAIASLVQPTGGR